MLMLVRPQEPCIIHVVALMTDESSEYNNEGFVYVLISGIFVSNACHVIGDSTEHGPLI